MRATRLLCSCAGVTLLAAACVWWLQPAFAASGAAASPENNAAEKAAMSKLHSSQFKGVSVSVDQNGIATLSGAVGLYEYKADAEKKVLHARGVTAVRDRIEVRGAELSDAQLRVELIKKLQYDRVGFGHVFDAITVQVQNGVVTLGGHVHNYPNRDSALALVSTTPGVQDVIDEMQVDPVSLMDEQTRMAVAQAVYGYPALNKYAMDPVRPIRISVQNGNVELYGMVDSKADKDMAGLRANAVPGVFSVKNYLQVANSVSESPR